MNMEGIYNPNPFFCLDPPQVLWMSWMCSIRQNKKDPNKTQRTGNEKEVRENQKYDASVVGCQGD